MLSVISSLLIVTSLMLTGCAETGYVPVTDTVTLTTTETMTIKTGTDTETAVLITTSSTETINEEEPPIIRISDKNYSQGDAFRFMRIPEDSVISLNPVSWALSNRQVYIDAAVAKAAELDLDSENLQEILTKLVLNIDQLDFGGKNIGDKRRCIYV